MDWLPMWQDPHQSAWLEILGACKTFLGEMHLLWAFAYNFSIRKACQFLIHVLLMPCSLWCLSGALQIIWFYSSKPPHSPLFSEATRHSKYANSVSAPQVRQYRYQSLRQLSEKPEHWMHIPLVSSPTRKNSLDGMFPSGTELCWLGGGVDMGKWNYSFYCFTVAILLLCIHLGYYNLLTGF